MVEAEVSRKTVTEAVNYLLSLDDARAVVRSIRRAVAEWARRPITFTDRLEPLNPLLSLGVRSPEGLESVLAVAEERLQSRPLEHRKAYQRELMRARRQRQYKAVKLRELQTGQRLTGEGRKQYMAEVQRRWMKARDRMLAEHPEAGWDERNLLIDKFWRDIDQKLDQNIKDAHQPHPLRKAG